MNLPKITCIQNTPIVKEVAHLIAFKTFLFETKFIGLVKAVATSKKAANTIGIPG